MGRETEDIERFLIDVLITCGTFMDREEKGIVSVNKIRVRKPCISNRQQRQGPFIFILYRLCEGQLQ